VDGLAICYSVGYSNFSFIAAKDLDGLSADMAKSYIEDQEWCLIGGSYYDQGTQRLEGPIRVR
jgi:hypothetical protein